jgi:hypothetical protein
VISLSTRLTSSKFDIDDLAQAIESGKIKSITINEDNIRQFGAALHNLFWSDADEEYDDIEEANDLLERVMNKSIGEIPE